MSLKDSAYSRSSKEMRKQAAVRNHIMRGLEDYNTKVESAKLKFMQKPYLHKSYPEFNQWFHTYRQTVDEFLAKLENLLLWGDLDKAFLRYSRLEDILRPIVDRLAIIADTEVSWEVPTFAERKPVPGVIPLDERLRSFKSSYPRMAKTITRTSSSDRVNSLKRFYHSLLESFAKRLENIIPPKENEAIVDGEKLYFEYLGKEYSKEINDLSARTLIDPSLLPELKSSIRIYAEKLEKMLEKIEQLGRGESVDDTFVFSEDSYSSSDEE